MKMRPNEEEKEMLGKEMINAAYYSLSDWDLGVLREIGDVTTITARLRSEIQRAMFAAAKVKRDFMRRLRASKDVASNCGYASDDNFLSPTVFEAVSIAVGVAIYESTTGTVLDIEEYSYLSLIGIPIRAIMDATAPFAAAKVLTDLATVYSEDEEVWLYTDSDPECMNLLEPLFGYLEGEAQDEHSRD